MKKKKIDNYVKFFLLPEHLKAEAIAKAVKMGYSEKEAKGLYYNNDGKVLVDGVMDKNFRFK